MEVFLYNSTVCRLCGEENDNGSLLYSSEENNQNLCEIINAYLPIKVSDDGILPRTICPGCTIQLEATVEFLNLIINGQRVIRRLHETEREYKKSISKNSQEPKIIAENIVYEINTSNGVYQVEHPVSLQVSGLEKPKRKRGRPTKQSKTQELPKETTQVQTEENKIDVCEEEELTGKRRRKTPIRYKEAVQGKELERIFLEEGVIDEEEKGIVNKVKSHLPIKPTTPKEPQVIGHLAESGEPVVLVKGKGRGRPKGRIRQTNEECPICGAQFTSVGRYMSHVAQHGKVQYRCGCGTVFTTHLAFSDHQKVTEHKGRIVEPYNEDDHEKMTSSPPLVTNTTASPQRSQAEEQPPGEPVAQPPPLPDLDDGPSTPLKEETVCHEEEVDVEATEKTDEDQRVGAESGLNNEQDPKSGAKKAKLKCHHCDKTYNSKQSRALHTKAVHLGERTYACAECGATFAYPRSLALHRISHRRARPAGFACDLCGKVLNHPSSVVYHKQTEHATQRYVCRSCGKTFRHKQLLQRHQLVHTEARPYNCKLCNSSFKTRANLVNHQLLHTGVKRFGCQDCKAVFAHKTSLTLHMRWHMGVKPYSCNVCDKSFSQKGNLSEHQRIHSGEKPYTCELCPRRFTTASQRRLHTRRHDQRTLANMETRELVMASPTKQLAGGERPKRQQSLLVTDKQQEGGLEEEQVVYVAFETAGSRVPSYTIVDAAQAVNIEENKLVRGCELYSGSSLLVRHQLRPLELESETLELETESKIENPQLELGNEQLVLENGQIELENVQLELASGNLVLEQGLSLKNDKTHVAVTDEEGRPLQLTMHDGTRLAITSLDGNSLQVITQDGRTIPVEINGLNDDEVSSPPDAVLQQMSAVKTEPAPGSITYLAIASLEDMFKK